jgi:DNA-binding transcriptional regulator YiaG
VRWSVDQSGKRGGVRIIYFYKAEEGKAERIYTPEQLLVQSARQKLNLSQTAFAKLIDTPVATCLLST